MEIEWFFFLFVDYVSSMVLYRTTFFLSFHITTRNVKIEHNPQNVKEENPHIFVFLLPFSNSLKKTVSLDNTEPHSIVWSFNFLLFLNKKLDK